MLFYRQGATVPPTSQVLALNRVGGAPSSRVVLPPRRDGLAHLRKVANHPRPKVPALKGWGERLPPGLFYRQGATVPPTSQVLALNR